MPHGHWKTTTFTGALRLTGMTAPFVYDGPMNGIVFLAYVEQVLGPTLRPGDMVVMDNLPAYKGTAIREAIERCGARLAFLPPYSPDFNPIENAFAAQTFGSPSSTPYCEPAPNAPSMHFGTQPANRSTPSNPANAQTTSPPQGMMQREPNVL